MNSRSESIKYVIELWRIEPVAQAATFQVDMILQKLTETDTNTKTFWLPSHLFVCKCVHQLSARLQRGRKPAVKRALPVEIKEDSKNWTFQKENIFYKMP